MNDSKKKDRSTWLPTNKSSQRGTNKENKETSISQIKYYTI